MIWSETQIARTLAIQFFKRKYLVVVPNCNWTGHECDMLCVTENLRIIDVEIKISRADLKADAKKEKLWHRPNNWAFTHASGGFSKHGPPAPDVALKWPPKIWKHYYVMPESIWCDDLLPCVGSLNSGVLLLREPNKHCNRVTIKTIRPAKPNRDAEKIPAAAAVDIARLASLRMWNAYQELNELRDEIAVMSTKTSASN